MRTLATLTLTILWTCGCDRKSETPLETKTSEGTVSEAPAGATAARKDQALVRFMNADPAPTGKELWAGDTRIFSGVEFKALTPYQEIPSQATQFRLLETSGAKNVDAVHDQIFAGRSYTYVAMPGKKGVSSLAAISDDLGPPKNGKARVRVINASLDMDHLALHMSGSSKKIGSTVRTGASSDFTDLEPGTYEIRIAERAPVARLSNLSVQADKFYTFVVVGQNADPEVIRVEERLDR